MPPAIGKHRRRRKGQSLVEFAIVAVVLYLLLAAILTFGMLLYGAQTIQQAADFAARELARTPLPAIINDFNDDVLRNAEVQQHVYSEKYLAVDITDWDSDEEPLLRFLEREPMPPVNRMLLPLMFVDKVEDGDRTLLRYPGALLQTADGEYTVMIPVVRYASNEDGEGVPDEQILRWLDVVEVRRPEFSIDSPERGLVSLRINYPYQSAVMSGFRERQHDFTDPDTRGKDPVIPIHADDTIAATPPPDGRMPVAPDIPDGSLGRNPYSGPFGLGRQAAWASEVRPFRQVISAQAVYRREIFLP